MLIKNLSVNLVICDVTTVCLNFLMCYPSVLCLLIMQLLSWPNQSFLPEGGAFTSLLRETHRQT